MRLESQVILDGHRVLFLCAGTLLPLVGPRLIQMGAPREPLAAALLLFRTCRGFVQGCFVTDLGRGFPFEAELVAAMLAIEIALNKGWLGWNRTLPMLSACSLLARPLFHGIIAVDGFGY